MSEPASPSNSSQIGLRQLRALANLQPRERWPLLAEGLPIILASARDLTAAAEKMQDHHRSADILRRHGEEEAAKILILMDHVRCPPGRSDWAAATLRTFYDHGARLIYADACTWKPTDVTMLQSYVDTRRQSHYVEGPNGDWIVPNWERLSREALLYADLTRFDSGSLGWNDPRQWGTGITFPSIAIAVGEALDRVGAFTPAGLAIVAKAWAATEFTGAAHHEDSHRLIKEMLCALDAAGLIADATDDDVSLLYRAWQLPMYSIDFKTIDVPLADLRDEQSRQFYSNYL